ncbi:conserved hypothetical protein [Candidatus Sulfopaludibacter sp. SbA3]|nr:conserved hypothetical protein [Candidatus Sulfopaludibacter sp. SbA3]
MALVVDDQALSFTSLVRVRDSLRKFVQQQMQPGDLVAMIRTGGGVAILEQFTTDPRVLLAAIDLLKWRFNGRTGLIPIRPESGAPAARPGDPQYLDYGVTLTALGALGTLQQVIHGMQRLPGRKSIVYLSDALRVDARINDALDRLTDLANRSAVSIYAIDPRGLRTDSMREADVAEQSDDSFGPMIPGMTETRGAAEFRSQEGLVTLARRTGGLFYANNDIAGSIRRSADDQLGYYLLAYTPKEGTFEKTLQKAKFHRLSVSVKRPGLHVRWKSGFTGVPDEVAVADLAPTPKTREQQLLEALASPFLATGLKVRLTSFYYDFGAAGAYVQSLLQFDAKDLSFTRQVDDKWHTRVDIVTSAYRNVNLPMQQWQRSQEIVLPDDQYRKALKEGFLFRLSDPMKLPGSFLMRAVVRDAVSQRIGAASELVQVPDTRKGQLAVSGIILNLAPAGAIPDGQPVDDIAPKDGSAEPWSEGGPALRRYRPGQRILYSFIVVNPKTKGSTKTTDVEYQLRLFRDGKVAFTGAFNRISDEFRIDGRRIAAAGLLHLSARFPPGEYLMRVVVNDKLAPKKQAHVAQWIDFEVVPFTTVTASQSGVPQ